MREVGQVLKFTSGFRFHHLPTSVQDRTHTPQCLQAFANAVLCAWKTSSSISSCYLPLKVKLPLGRMNPSLTILNSEYFADNSMIERVKYCSYSSALQLDPELHQAGLDLNYIRISRNKLWDGVQFMCSQKCREDTNLKLLFPRVHFKARKQK